MKWITKEEVREHATTPERALDISIKHHQQIVDATEEEFETQRDTRTHPLGPDLCGLCQHYTPNRWDGCGECPLQETHINCFSDDSLYREVLNMYQAKPFNHKAFIKAETALLNRLKQLKTGDKSMDRKQEIEISIKQNKKDQQRLRDEAKDLEQQLAETEVTEFSVDGRVVVSTEDDDGWIKLSIAGWDDTRHPCERKENAQAWHLSKRTAKKLYDYLGQAIEKIGGKL